MPGEGAPPIQLLYDAGGPGEAGTAAERHYGGPLRLEGGSPHVFANFVSTLDGVVALGLGDGTDSSVISGRHPADRFMLGLLRAVADVVLIGAGTLRASPGHRWVPPVPAPEWTGAFTELRAARQLRAAQPRLVVVSGSGDLPQHSALDDGGEALVLTSDTGAACLSATHPSLARVVIGDPPFAGAAVIAAVVASTRAHHVLCEGGPTLMGSMVAAGVVHDLFLSISAQLAGRDATNPRPGLVAGDAAPASALHHAELRSVRRSGDLLLLHHRLR